MLRQLARMTSDELREATASGHAIAVVPIGSVEQHGPDGPLGTDGFCAEAVARVVADELDACLAPTLPYGESSIHRAAAGDIHRAELIGDPTLTYITMFQDHSPSGAFGDPTGSAPELGERIARAAGGAIARRARLLQDTFSRPVAAEHEPGRPRSAQA
jgi:creatinine amidohydrolase/Fe(II)-dependent formamide hydrolase-like protein